MTSGGELWRPSATLPTLQYRAKVLRDIRQWCFENSILEVETPQLCTAANTDPQIESFSVSLRSGRRFLRTSAEFYLKRMLAAGVGDVYELAKVFRYDEVGRHHNPEFTMLEWYRCGMDHHALINDVEALLQALHGNTWPGMQRYSYRELFQHHLAVDLSRDGNEKVLAALQRVGVDVPLSIVNDRDALLDLAMATHVGEQLAKQQYTCIYDYPASQASLAKINCSDPTWHVASRFEIYFGALELANGFHELTDANEQRRRFESENVRRQESALKVVPIDQHLLEALTDGLPECSGVAIGVDRLLLALSADFDNLTDVVSFAWQHG